MNGGSGGEGVGMSFTVGLYTQVSEKADAMWDVEV